MKKPMTRARALARAIQSMQREEIEMRRSNQLVQDSLYRSVEYKVKKEADYAELAAALAYIENMARQKELL